MLNPEALRYVTVILSGLSYTAILTIGGLIIGLILGLFLSFLEVFMSKPISSIASAIGQIIRGIPLIVIFFILYFGLTELGINLTPTLAAILGLGIRSGAYQSQIFRSSIEAIGKGQWEAALSIGMTRVQAFTNIIIPQVLRISIPAWTNELAIVLKDTSIAYAVGVSEIFTQAIHVAQATSDYLTPLSIVALIYFIITFSINRVLNRIYRKYMVPGLGGGVER